MNLPAYITRLMTFAQYGQPQKYAASDLMRSDLEQLIKQAFTPAAAEQTERVEPAKPVAWYIEEHGDIVDLEWDTNKPNTTCGDWKPLYNAPPAAAVSEPLTDEQIDKAWRSVDYIQPYKHFRIAIARAIEAAHNRGEK